MIKYNLVGTICVLWVVGYLLSLWIAVPIALVTDQKINDSGSDSAISLNKAFQPITTTLETLSVVEPSSSQANAMQVVGGNGLDYLTASQNPDGSWGGTSASLNGIFPTTASALQALRVLEEGSSSTQADAIEFLSEESVEVTPFLAQRVLALAGTGENIADDLDMLLARRNEDGGWGTMDGFESNVWDTALVLAALRAGNVDEQAISSKGLTYLIYAREVSQGWGLMRGDTSRLFYTALVLQTLNAYDATFALGALQTQVVTYLRTQQHTDGGYGEPESTPFETALVLQAILEAGVPLTAAEDDATNYLDTQQLADGSWVDDPYSTALALRALAIPPDSDGDGMSDTCETTYNLNPNDPSDAALDNDGEGLPNRDECLLGTNPNLADSDTDTVDDWTEVTCASDPLDINDANQPPQITSQPQFTTPEEQAYSYALTANDPDGDALTFTLLEAPNGMSISSGGLISWAAPQAGTHHIVVEASDGGCAERQPYNLTVLPAGIDLVVAGVNITEISTDLDTLAAHGSLEVGLRNQGGTTFTGRFDVLLFEDLTGTGTYIAESDQLLGDGTFAGTIASNEVISLTINMAGVVQFRDNLIHVWADSREEIPELDESNNIAHSGEYSQYEPPARDWLPVVEWAWNAPNTTWPGVAHAPTVAPLIDTNGDGLINERDVPAVIFVASSTSSDGRLIALHGDTGTEIFNVPSPSGGNFSALGHTPAVGDLDGDGQPEIVVSTFNETDLYAFNNDGSLKWEQPTLILGNGTNTVFSDLDGDGQSELLHASQIFNADGTLHANAIHSLTNYWGGNTGSRHVADLNLDGEAEIVAGASTYDGDGNMLWYWRIQSSIGDDIVMEYSLDGGETIETLTTDAAFADGWTAVANIDADPEAEVILTSMNYDTLTIFDHDGQLHLGPLQLFQDIVNTVKFELGPPTVADFDGDGQPEIALSVNQTQLGATFNDPSQIILLMYEADGSLIWQKEMFPEKVASYSPVPTAFDFDGDGIYELLFLDRQRFYIINGPDGTILYETAINRVNDGWPVRYPTVADVDNDGNAEIVVPTYYHYQVGTPTRNGLLVLGDANDNWLPARRIWNQWHYSASHINEDGSIPASPSQSWQTHKTYRAQLPIDGLSPFAAPDLTISRVTLNDEMCPASAGITARIGNGGGLHVAAGQEVNFYQGDPLADGILITRTHTTQALYPSDFEEVTIDWNNPTDDAIYVTVNSPLTPPLIQTDNLTQLPHTYANASGFCAAGCIMSFNGYAFRGIDGNFNNGWILDWSGNDSDPRPDFYEVHFPFPVNSTAITVTNNYPNTGFLTGVIDFSNGFSTPFDFGSEGSGTVSFPEQTEITWLRLTATTTKPDGASLHELEVVGSYQEPTILLNEGVGRMGNNSAVAATTYAPCDTPPANQAPQITSAPVVTVDLLEEYSYAITALDPDNDPLTFSLLTAPTGMTVNPTSGLLTWTPTEEGSFPVTVQVADTQAESDSQSFTLDVIISRDVNHPPQITSTPPASVIFGQPYSYDVAATDADNDALFFDLLTAPANATINNQTGELEWTASEDQVGIHFFTVAVQDSSSQSSQSFTVTVEPANLPLDPLPVDEDEDGFDETTDCDDTNPDVNPAQPELPGNGIDDDCNPATPDSISSDTLNCSIVTLKRSYPSNSLAQMTISIQNESTNSVIAGLEGQVTVSDSDEQALMNETLSITSLPPNGLYRATLGFETEDYPTGTYLSTIQLQAGSSTLCQAEATFELVPTTVEPTTGTLYLPIIRR